MDFCEVVNVWSIMDTTGRVGHPGLVTGHVVNRDMALACDGFLTAMDSLGTECRFLAHTIFDDRAQLLPKWISGTRDGSGIWDSRLNTGNFLVIETAKVAEHSRGNGIGSCMVSQLLQKAKDRDIDWVFVWPHRVLEEGLPLNSNESIACAPQMPHYRSADRNEKERTIKFWKSMGFRRIGRSHWFCYAVADDDPSRNLSVEGDHFDSDEEVGEKWLSTSPSTMNDYFNESPLFSAVKGLNASKLNRVSADSQEVSNNSKLEMHLEKSESIDIRPSRTMMLVKRTKRSK